MENNETQFENLENLSVEELEAQAEEETTEPIDWKSKAEEALRKANALQRILNKKKPITSNKLTDSTTTDVSKDIAEIKFIHKVSSFAEENGITKVQAEKVLLLYPNATSETLKDPFIAEGLKAIAKKERVESATPGAGRPTTVNGKSFSEMSREERQANFSSFIPK